jgi:hypothetical protein
MDGQIRAIPSTLVARADPAQVESPDRVKMLDKTKG